MWSSSYKQMACVFLFEACHCHPVLRNSPERLVLFRQMRCFNSRLRQSQLSTQSILKLMKPKSTLEKNHDEEHHRQKRKQATEVENPLGHGVGRLWHRRNGCVRHWFFVSGFGAICDSAIYDENQLCLLRFASVSNLYDLCCQAQFQEPY